MNQLTISFRSSPLKGQKILFVFDCLELGGAERQALHLARHLKDKIGADVSVLGLSLDSGKISALCREAGIPWQGMSCTVPGRMRDWLATLWALYKNIKCAQPAVLLPYTWRPNVLCGLLWKFTDAKLCVWNQRDEGICLNDSFWHRTAIRMSSSFVSNSFLGKQFLAENYGVARDRIKVIPNGVTLDQPVLDRREWRRKLKLDDTSFVTCMVGNLHQFKDHATLIKAWREVLNLAPDGQRDATLLPAGRFSGTEQYLQCLVKELELANSVRLLNKVDDISGLLLSVDLCIHSSFTEGLPNAILEAMASGLPVVGSDIAGVREVLGEAGAQGLVPVGNASAMACKILVFMNDEVLRNKIGCDLKQRAERHYKLSTMLDKSVDTLGSLVD